eukprot:scaffold203386_cov51-Attheya_sp.AAC.3
MSTKISRLFRELVDARNMTHDQLFQPRLIIFVEYGDNGGASFYHPNITTDRSVSYIYEEGRNNGSQTIRHW